MEEDPLRSNSAQDKTLMIYDVFGEGHPCKVWQQKSQYQQPDNSDPSRRAGKAWARSHTTESGTNSSFCRTHRQFNVYNQYFNLYSTFIRSSPYGPTPTLLVQLAEHNNRPIAAPGGKGLQARAIVNLSSDLTTSSHGVQERPGSGGIRGAEIVGQGSGKDIQLLSQPVPQQNISGSQEGWFLQASDQFEITEPIHSKTHFNMKSLSMIRDLLREGDWMASIYLKDAYLSVMIWEEHWKYLRFLWESTMYEFHCLPFGLSSIPRVFTKLLKPVLERLHHQGVRLIMYLDNMLLMAQSQVEFE